MSRVTEKAAAVYFDHDDRLGVVVRHPSFYVNRGFATIRPKPTEETADAESDTGINNGGDSEPGGRGPRESGVDVAGGS